MYFRSAFNFVRIDRNIVKFLVSRVPITPRTMRSPSSSPSPPRRKRHDSDDEGSPPRRPAKRERHDSESPPRRSRHDSESPPRRPKMSSGHFAGLQTGSQFGDRERALKRGADKTDVKGAGAATVYRDSTGRRLSEREIQRMEDDARMEKERGKREEIDYRVGRAQKRELGNIRREEALVRSEAFARRADDERIDEERRNRMRSGDPMAMFVKQKAKGKREYKGPPPPPNRYGIRPGYRWDGVHRGNGFESRVLTAKAGLSSRSEKKHLWRTADM